MLGFVNQPRKQRRCVLSIHRASEDVAFSGRRLASHLLPSRKKPQRTWAPSGRRSLLRHEKIRNRNVMFSISLYLWYSHMPENQQSRKTKVLFPNVSSSLSSRNLGSSGQKLHRLVIHPFLGLRTDSAGRFRLRETINI
jgi:hypothetical protein